MLVHLFSTSSLSSKTERIEMRLLIIFALLSVAFGFSYYKPGSEILECFTKYLDSIQDFFDFRKPLSVQQRQKLRIRTTYLRMRIPTLLRIRIRMRLLQAPNQMCFLQKHR